MNEKTVGRDSDKFMLRFPDGMRDALKRAAAENGRSLNAEIIQRLESTFREVSITSAEELDAAFSGQSPFEEAVQERAGQVLALALQMAVDRLEASKAISKEAADQARADQKARKGGLSEIKAGKSGLSSIKPTSD